MSSSTSKTTPKISQDLSRLPGFYALSVEERRAILMERVDFPEDERRALDAACGLQMEHADKMVENAVGIFGLPLGVALNFIVDETPVLVPMAVEEPSVVAACSFIAKLAALGGGFTTDVDRSIMTGQVQILDDGTGNFDPARAVAIIREQQAAIIEKGNAFCDGLYKRGGGVIGATARILPPLTTGPHAAYDDNTAMIVVDIAIDTCEAMGANAINTVAEGLAPFLESLVGGRARLRILSNLSDQRLARASMRIPYEALGGRDVAVGIVEAYRFAARDPYRACTHNKGILNGIDAVAIATGNDWRAIEAGAHAYAALSGSYTSLSTFWLDDATGMLHGKLVVPMAVGVVGGSTVFHPTVRACRRLLGSFAQSASKLAGLLAAVGLSQNTAALRALATEGIQRGHMALHAKKHAAPTATHTAANPTVSISVTSVEQQHLPECNTGRSA